MFPSPLPELPPVANTKKDVGFLSLLSYRAFTDDDDNDVIVVFDQFDRLITMTTVTAAYDAFFTNTYAYEDDRVATLTHSDGDGDRRHTNFHYDADGRVTVARTFLSSSTELSVSVLTYEDHQVTEEIIDYEGRRKTTIYRLDDAGRVLALWTGIYLELITYRLDDFGRIVATDDVEPQSLWRPHLLDGRVLAPDDPKLGVATQTN